MVKVIEGGLRTDDAPARLRSEGDEDIHIQRGKRFRTARPSSLAPKDLERRIISTAMALRTEQLPANSVAGGCAEPSVASSQRSDGVLFSFRSGLVTSTTAHLPSGDNDGAATRLSAHQSSTESGCVATKASRVVLRRNGATRQKIWPY